MGRRAVRVFVRTRPTPALASGLSFTESQCVIARSFTSSSPSAASEATALAVDGVLHNATQEEVYATTAAPVVDAVLRGGNGAVIAYGPTGAGKSFTMAGQTSSADRAAAPAAAAPLKDASSDNKSGVIPRALRHIFEELVRRGGNDREGAVSVSYLEIYNEVMRDLLEPAKPQAAVVAAGTGGSQEHGAVCVKGLSCKAVQSEAEALEWFLKGEAARTTGPHALNTLSSRSHAVFIVSIASQYTDDVKPHGAQLALVDLAGSERTKKSGSGGLALQEAKFINKSLSFLEQTVAALAAAARRRKFTNAMGAGSSDGNEHVPFRQTKLTEVLRGALSGGGQAAMIACVWPKDAQVEETLGALRFAARVRALQTDGKMSTPLHLSQTTDGNIFKAMDFDSDPGDVRPGAQLATPRARTPAHDAASHPNDDHPDSLGVAELDQNAPVDEDDDSLVGEYDTSVPGFGIGEAPPDARPPKGLDALDSMPIPQPDAPAAMMMMTPGRRRSRAPEQNRRKRQYSRRAQ